MDWAFAYQFHDQWPTLLNAWSTISYQIWKRSTLSQKVSLDHGNIDHGNTIFLSLLYSSLE